MKPIIPIMAVCLLILAIPSAYAMSYQGSASLTSEGIDSSCVCLNLFLKDGDEYTSLPSDALFSEKIGVTKSNTNRYSANVTNYLLTSENLYLMASSDCTFSWDYILSLGSTYNVTVTARLNGTALAKDTGTALAGNTYVPFALYATGTYAQSTSMPELGLSVTLTATDLSDGVYSQGSLTAVRLLATSSASVLEIMKENNDELVTSGGYTFTETTSTNHGNNYPAVGIRNDDNYQNGISDRNGQIDVEITIPQGPDFVIYLRTSGSNTFTINMSKGDEVLLSGTVTFNAGGYGTSGYYLSSHSYDGSSSGYFYASLNNVNTYNAWMSGNTSDITLTITTEDGQSASRNLKMDIVFKKES